MRIASVTEEASDKGHRGQVYSRRFPGKDMLVSGLGGIGGRASWTSLFQLRVIPNQLGNFAAQRDKERVRAGVCEGGEVPLCHFGLVVTCMRAE